MTIVRRSAWLGLAASCLLSFPLQAAEPVVTEQYRCTHKDQQRLIWVAYEQVGQQIPCAVYYQKDGQQQTLWQASKTVGYCERKAAEFVAKQESWGWQCQIETVAAKAAEKDATPPMDEQDQTFLNHQERYRHSARFAGLLQALTPIKLEVDQYANLHGEFPSDLTDLGRQAPVQSKEYDAVKISHGIIAAQANAGWPTPAIVRLTPTFSSVGGKIDWDCNTNVELIDQSVCDFYPNLVY
ncbi:hypothetical protein GCM10011297_07370 [Bacterioplanes sanyensis]|uniref:hypothetical protein n=1 Tax=Bacterioplanes sanyensis TaxID=1249553 RepID=UPI00167A9D7C|nr:hypothetical protein [Bacterioplanes sanyensis]GGY36797.1 hypothetical protein GCM10011297_07370 [Bacterioplanes sanyensis]